MHKSQKNIEKMFTQQNKQYHIRIKRKTKKYSGEKINISIFKNSNKFCQPSRAIHTYKSIHFTMKSIYRYANISISSLIQYTTFDYTNSLEGLSSGRSPTQCVFIFAVQWAGLLISRPLAVRPLSFNVKPTLKLYFRITSPLYILNSCLKHFKKHITKLNVEF